MHIIVIFFLIFSALSPLNVYAEKDRTPKLTVRVKEMKHSVTIPLKDAEVLLGGRPMGKTDEDGELVIYDKRLNSGDPLVIKKEGYSSGEGDLNKKGNGELGNELEFVLWKTRIEIMVLENAGNGKQPSDNAKIYIDGQLYGETDKDGLLKLQNVKPEKYLLSVRKQGFSDTQKEIYLDESINETIELNENQTRWRSDNHGTIDIRKAMKIAFVSLPGPLCIFGLVLLLRSRAGSYKVFAVVNNRRCQVRLRLLAANEMGGMAIYVGSNPFAGIQKVIFKVLQNPVLGKESFENEVAVHAALKDKGIHETHLAPYLGSGFLEQGKRPVMIFKYLKEKSVKQIIRSKNYTLKQAIRLGIGLCEPVQAIHNAGYCRLDLKPAHLILRGPCRFALIDVATALTIGSQNRMLYETANYTPKEAHDPHIAIDHRSDIYSLGKIFEELFKKFIEGPEVNNHRAAHIQTIQAVIIKMTRENRSERYESISEVVNELQALL